MSCQTCGHEAEGDIQPHNFGCAESFAARQRREAAVLAKVVEADAKKRPEDIEEYYSLEECAKDGCAEPRAVSRGPRPAKYCDEHKSVRSK
ncbi:hypothetical protein [Streptomyces sp. NPDC058664]|uniref:hypothetical protein n=1 Tax=unclassified Streptomyces TaxID=2593676 RepID=UPI00364F1AB1